MHGYAEEKIRKVEKRGLVWFFFYGISTIVGYLMPNPFYTYKHVVAVLFYSISTLFG